MAAAPQLAEGGITVDSLIWSVTCAISATDPVQSDQGLKLDSAPHLPRKTPGSSSKHKRSKKKKKTPVTRLALCRHHLENKIITTLFWHKNTKELEQKTKQKKG